MIKRTLGDVKPELRRVAGAAGLKAGDDRLVDYINLAEENLLAKCKTVVGSLHRLKFMQLGGLIALPSRYERIVKGAINRGPGEVFGQWYEFLDFGPGQQDTSHAPLQANGFIDRGESPVIRQSTDKARLLRLYTNVDERVPGPIVGDSYTLVRPTVQVMGYDENGQWIRSETTPTVWVDGVSLALNGDLQNNWSQSTQLFSKVTQVVKPVTKAACELHFYDATRDKTFLAGRYEYSETNPSMRMYLFPAINQDTDLVHVLAKVRHRKAVNDTDLLTISNLPALRHAMRALAKEDCDEYQAANDLWTLAKMAIADEAREYYGNSSPIADVHPGGSITGGIAPVI